jgi:hypothetical protein
MYEEFQKYIPLKAVAPCSDLVQKNGAKIKVVSKRVTRHGDYRKKPNGDHLITINASVNKYRFLITLLHELAHLVAFEMHGRHIKPHGLEWKITFRDIMLPFLRPQIFPADLLPLLATHFKNPKASSTTDTNLSMALKAYDELANTSYVFELPSGSIFKLYNGKEFKKGRRKVKRYECVEMATGRIYLFQPHAEVELIRQEVV